MTDWQEGWQLAEARREEQREAIDREREEMALAELNEAHARPPVQEDYDCNCGMDRADDCRCFAGGS